MGDEKKSEVTWVLTNTKKQITFVSWQEISKRTNAKNVKIVRVYCKIPWSWRVTCTGCTGPNFRWCQTEAMIESSLSIHTNIFCWLLNPWKHWKIKIRQNRDKDKGQGKDVIKNMRLYHLMNTSILLSNVCKKTHFKTVFLSPQKSKSGQANTWNLSSHNDIIITQTYRNRIRHPYHLESA